jgi:hypothetical protein
VAIANTTKNFFVSFASFTLLDAFAAVGDFVAAVELVFFLLIIFVYFKKLKSEFYF